MTKREQLAWIAGVICFFTAFYLDWRAAGFMFVSAFFNNILRDRDT